MASNRFTPLCVLLCGASLLACSRTPTTENIEVAAASSAGAKAAPSAAASPVPAGTAAAALGKPAPSFSLPDEVGATVSLDAYKGKIVVLEWFNPDCPFVRASHEKGSMVNAAKRAGQKGVVWLAINSSGPGKQGYGAERNAAQKKAWNLPNPILLDESGTVGKAYGARRTPHMFVIDDKGILVYAGAIDNSPDGEGGSPAGGVLVSYVDAALDDLAANRPVSKPSTEPYGCSVKFAE